MTLEQIIEPAVKLAGLTLWGCEVFTSGRTKTLRIFIDKPGGVDIDDCERASRQVSAVLDVEDPFKEQFQLEVSSPGLDRPLFKQEHFEQFLQERARVRMHTAIEGRRNFVGKIVDVNEQTLSLLNDKGEKIELLFNDIEKANLIPDLR